MSMRLVLALVALSLGMGGLLAGDAQPPAGSAAGRRLIASEVERETDHVTPLELAQWIHDRRPGLRVIDVRADSEYAAYHIPGAERMSLADVAGARWTGGGTVVLYSEGGAHAAQAWVLLRGAGMRDVYFLRGGILEWLDDVMQPVQSTALTRYFGGTARASSSVPIPVRAPDAVRRLRRRSC